MDIGCYAVSSSRYMMGGEPKRVISLVNRDPQLGVVGTSGKLSLQIPFNMYPDVPAELSVKTSIGTRTVQCGTAGQYRLMFDAFSESLLSGKPEPTPAEDAVANMKVLDALFRSETSGSWEAIG